MVNRFAVPFTSTFDQIWFTGGPSMTPSGKNSHKSPISSLSALSNQPSGAPE
jgi:hypothetical protein